MYTHVGEPQGIANVPPRLSFLCLPSFVLCTCSASDDIPGADDVRALVKDIWDLRMAKLRKSTDLMVSEQESHALVSRPVCQTAQ